MGSDHLLSSPPSHKSPHSPNLAACPAGGSILLAGPSTWLRFSPHWTANIFPWMKPQQPLLGCCPRLAQLPSHSSPVVVHAALGSPGGMQPVRRQYRTVARLGISGVGPHYPGWPCLPPPGRHLCQDHPQALPSLAQPFKPHELSSALATLKPGKAPGLDKVPYDFIRHLTPPLRACLLQLYNSSWQSGQFPSTWKPAILIPIHKPGKDPTLPSAYRPISLLSCIGKLLERLVNTRLTWWLEANNKLAEEQCGFRPHRSTLDVLGQIEYHICDTYRQRQVMTALFLDLEGAFDSAPHEGILYKLALMGITGTTLAWSSTHTLRGSGPPAGGCHRLGCMDDNLGATSQCLKELSHVFYHEKLPTPPTVNLSGEAVPYSTSHTLLGLRLDGPRLSWVNHISYLRTSCNKRLDVMKRIAGIRWGASRDLLLHYYKTTIRAKMQYASCFYGSAAYSNLLKLDPIQNAALRISMGP
ncbi:uncharacterized protein LOC123498419 [Portunus trituberculatus]|uniref:uncharacterized protein LOC123498419 n=1 Tax=Portunus trituberculatus TaxID=210409 RepID=UPI001E1CB40C|nr:uncharacterized protein LOC123498419 [Portunus trituberculatus]